MQADTEQKGTVSMSSSRSRTRPITLVTAAGAALVVTLVLPGSVGAAPKPTLDQVQQQLDDLYAEAEMVSEEANAATEQLTEIERQVARSQSAVATHTDRVRQLSADLGGYAAASYRSGGMDPLLEVLLDDDPAGFLARAARVEALAGQQQAQLATVSRARLDLVEAQAAADARLARQRSTQQVLADRQAQLDSMIAEEQALLDRLTAEERARLAAEEERQRAASMVARDAVRGQPAPEEPAPPAPPASGRAAVAVDAALSRVGMPYVYGSTGPGSFDCSGLTSWSWGQAGVALPRSSGAQYAAGTKVSFDDLQPGDLVYYDTPISHVAIYIGGGQVVSASNPRTDVVVTGVRDAGGPSKPYVGATRP